MYVFRFVGMKLVRLRSGIIQKASQNKMQNQTRLETKRSLQKARLDKNGLKQKRDSKKQNWAGKT